MNRMGIVAVIALGAAACAQPAPPPPPPPAPPSTAVTESLKSGYGIVKDDLTKTAAQITDKQLSFKPVGVVTEVRNFGQILGHVADANYLFCSAALGEKGPDHDVEHTFKTKADLEKALADAFAYCDTAFAGMDDVKGAEAVTTVVGPSTRLGALAFNTAHDFEHYGNLVTYMRAMKMVPPSSQPAGK
jgi:uncharacterized damage-inducible protein DinB